MDDCLSGDEIVILNVKVEGVDKAVQKLGLLRASHGRKIIRKAVRAGATPMVKAARQNALAIKDSGALAKNATSRQKTKGDIVQARISFTNVARTGVDRRGKTVTRYPTRYAHLVELGHRIAVNPFTRRSAANYVLKRRGRDFIPAKKFLAQDVGFVPGVPFMRRAFEQSKAQQLEKLGTTLANEMKKVCAA